MPPKVVCGNPLFLQWLEEAAREAADKGSKLEFAYKKAATSMRQCPITFDHPEQTRQLVGVGDTIIGLLKRKLKRHCQEAGQAMPDTPEPVKKVKGAPKKRKAPASGARTRDNSDVENEDVSIAGGALGNLDGLDMFRSKSSQGVGPKSGPTAAGGDVLGGLDGLDMFKGPRGSVRTAVSDESDDDDDPAFLKKLAEVENGLPSRKTKKVKTKKQYYPRKASGAYAILLALHSKASEDMHNEMSKAEIIETAESGGWCEATFQKAKDGSYATAWNGMSTLVSNGYVIQKGSRLAKWHLSEAGFNVAQQQYDLLPVEPFEQDRRDHLLSSQAGPSFRPEPTAASLRNVEPVWRVDIDSLANLRKAIAPPSANPLDLLNAAVGRDSGSAGRQAALRRSGREVAGGGKGSAAPKDNRFYFTYLDKADNRVLHKTQSRVKLLGDGFAHHKIELYASQSTHAFVRSNVVQLELAPAGRPSTTESTMFGWLPDDEDAPDMAVGLSRPAQVVAPSVRVASSSPRGPPSSSAPSALAARLTSSFSRVNYAPASISTGTASSRASRTAEILALATNRSQSNSAVASSSRSFSTSATSLLVPTPSNLARPTPLGTSKASNSDLGPHQRPRSSVQINSVEPVNARAESSTSAQSLLPKVKPIVWHAGSYEIVLLMDHRERSGKQGEQGAVRLQEMGVNAETSNDMVLGDIMWVARRTDGGQEGGVSECVLDYIIERKRLDDLVHSIRDGRYREQKSRLTNSGIGQVVYLLENYHVHEQQAHWWSSITTAKTSMQIIEGFFVHQSESWEGSLTYLKSMHEAIVEVHQNESLYIIPDQDITRATYMALQKQLRTDHPTKPHLTSIDAFKALNSKNASLTVQDVFCKMLLTINGLSPEKVAAIVEVHPTVMSLYRALQAAESEEQDARADAVNFTGKGKPKIPLAENYLARTIQGNNRQKIGPALSKKVYEFFRAEEYSNASPPSDD